MTTINSTLIDFINLSSTTCIPDGYQKAFPQESVNDPAFVENNYYKLMKSFANAEETFEFFKELSAILISRPLNPELANILLLDALKNALGINFVRENLSETDTRSVLLAKLLANINNGNIVNTLQIFQALMNPKFIKRVSLGSINISYAAIGGNLPITTEELKTFWDAAGTAGIFIELRKAPLGYFGFSTFKASGRVADSNAKGFATLASGSTRIIRKVNPFFAFRTIPNPTPQTYGRGFGTTISNVGGQMATLVLPTQNGGNFANIIYTRG